MKRLVALLAGAALMLLTTSAMATPISGGIAFMGGLQLTGSGTPLNTQDATGIHFINPSLVTTGATGTFASIPGFPPFITPVTFNDFTFSPTLSPAPVTPLWTFTSGLSTFDFILNSVTVTRVVPNGLLLNGSGIMQGTGFSDTIGSWALTTQDGRTGILSFSAASSVPEPGTMMLLGAGFLGLAIYGKRRKNG